MGGSNDLDFKLAERAERDEHHTLAATKTRDPRILFESENYRLVMPDIIASGPRLPGGRPQAKGSIIVEMRDADSLGNAQWRSIKSIAYGERYDGEYRIMASLAGLSMPEVKAKEPTVYRGPNGSGRFA